MNDFDVLVVTALPEEFEAAKMAAGDAQWREHVPAGSAPPVLVGRIATAGGGQLDVALARLPRMSGRTTGVITTALTEAVRPTCLAMSGVCAGSPYETAPGDVVVAAPAFQYDEGKQRDTEFQGDLQQLPLEERWLRAVQDYEPTHLPSYGTASEADATVWFLERLLLRQDPRTHAARSRYFPPGAWAVRLDRLEREGLIRREAAGEVALTDAGRAKIERIRYDDVDGPGQLPFAVLAGPMASGNAVIQDPQIWQRLRRMGSRRIAALDMEGATVATVANQCRVPHWLVAKGVMDAAELDREHRFRLFAARASAEVLFDLLGKLLPQRGDSPAILPTATGASAYLRPRRRPVHSIPQPESGDIARTGIAQALIARLTSADARLVAMTTALAGAGGFGKTTIARMLVHDSEVRNHYPDGIIWVTVGEELQGPALAGAIDNACAAITGVKPPFTDPMSAGVELGSALGAGRFLLVVDDVWYPEQLKPLLHGGPNTVRLVTTRRRSVLPSDASTVDVDAMTAMEARGLLTSGLGEIPEAAQADLLGMTGRWPVLLGLINGAARVDVRDGAEPSAALLHIRDSLLDSGLTALDPGNPHSRADAVSATVGVSLDRLTLDERRRFHELAIFPEDVEVPMSVVARYWAFTGNMSGARAPALLRTLADLSLLTSSWRDDTPRLRLHDVIRLYLRDAVTDELNDLNGRFLDAHRDLLAGGEWWQAPPDDAYLWAWIPAHLAGAGRQDELRRTVLHPRWLTAKLDRPGAAAVAADLILCRNNTAAYLEGIIRQNAHLLGQLDPPGAAAATLASRIRPGTPASAIADELVNAFDTPQLVATARPPDLTQAALIRVLTHEGRRPGPLVVTPDGSLLISGSGGGTVDLWDGDTGAEVKTWQHGGNVIALEVADDGSWVASSGEGVRIWDLAMKVERHVLDGPTDDVTCLASTPDSKQLIGGDTHGYLWVWNTATGELRYRLADHRATVLVLAVSPDGHYLASGGGSALPEQDTAIRLWDLRTGELQQVLPEHPGPVRTLRFAPDGTWLAAAGMDDAIRLWDARSGDLRGEISSGAKFVDALIVSADGAWLAASGGSLMDNETGFVGVWDLDGSGPRQRWRQSGLAEQQALALEPEGNLLLSGGGTLLGEGADNFVRVWYVESGELYSTLVGHSNGVSGIVAPRHRRWTATTSNDGTIRVWRYESANTPSADTAVAMVTGDPGGRWLATACEDRLHVRNTTTGAVDQVLDAGDRKIEAMTVAPDGSWLATGGQDRLIRIWDTATWGLVKQLGPHSFWVTSLAPTASDQGTGPGRHGTLLACDGSIRLWDVRSGSEVTDPEFAELEDPLKVIAVAPDLSWFAGGGGETSSRAENPVVIRELHTGNNYVLPAHRRDIAALAVAPDGSWLASTGDSRVLIWDPRSGRLRHELSDGSELLRLLVAGPDGRWLAAAGQDGRVRVWDPVTGGLRFILPGHTGPVRALAVVDRQRLVTAGDDRSIRIWDVTTGAAVCAIRVDGGLTALAAHGQLVQAGGARGCYFLRIAG